jgi:ABC-type multidrug transport system fused ATPase/permease subunit
MKPSDAGNHSEREDFIGSTLNESMQDSTLLVVAHRLSTVMHADKILVMKDGQLSEQGKHHELVLKEGEYRRLWDQQSQGIRTKP